MQAVSCPRCGGWSRVRSEAVGQAVTCPYCALPFRASGDAAPAAEIEASSKSKPHLVYATGRTRTKPSKAIEDDYDFDLPAPASYHPTPLMLALCLFPVGIPLGWWAARFLAPGIAPVFSFAAPTALAIGLVGLCFGIAYAAGWSTGTRFRAILMLIAVGYGSAGFLYCLKKEWAEAVRRRVEAPEPRWREFRPPDNAFAASMPGNPKTANADQYALPGWRLQCFRTGAGAADDRKAELLAASYVVASGKPPATVEADFVDEDWFAAAKKALAEGSGGDVTSEKVVSLQSYPGREYVVALPDGATTRVVRIFRAQRSAFYLSVEGAFLTGDARNVRTFFDKFQIQPNPK